MNTMISFSHLLGSLTKNPMYIPKYSEQWADRMEDYLHEIHEDILSCITGGERPSERLHQVGTVSSDPSVVSQADRIKANNKRCLHELHGALTPVVYNYGHGCKTTKEIWIL